MVSYAILTGLWLLALFACYWAGCIHGHADGTKDAERRVRFQRARVEDVEDELREARRQLLRCLPTSPDLEAQLADAPTVPKVPSVPPVSE